MELIYEAAKVAAILMGLAGCALVLALVAAKTYDEVRRVLGRPGAPR